jgi:hypothetical protein
MFSTFRIRVQQKIQVKYSGNVSIMKLCGWQNYIRYNEISLHWNILKMSQMFTQVILLCGCDRIERKQRTFARIYIGQSESHGHWTAGRIQSWKCLHCRLLFWFHSTEIVTNELVNVVMYRQFLFFKSLPVIVKFISIVILCNALDLYSFLFFN